MINLTIIKRSNNKLHRDIVDRLREAPEDFSDDDLMRIVSANKNGMYQSGRFSVLPIIAVLEFQRRHSPSESVSTMRKKNEAEI